jgi:hypothetical protein
LHASSVKKKQTSPETNASGDEYKPTQIRANLDYGLRGSFSPLPTANKAASFHSSTRKKKRSPETNASGDI